MFVRLCVCARVRCLQSPFTFVHIYPWRGQLQASINILIFWPHLILPFVKHPFHHLPLTKPGNAVCLKEENEKEEGGEPSQPRISYMVTKGVVGGWERGHGEFTWHFWTSVLVFVRLLKKNRWMAVRKQKHLKNEKEEEAEKVRNKITVYFVLF